jgi:hypothetical protein
VTLAEADGTVIRSWAGRCDRGQCRGDAPDAGLAGWPDGGGRMLLPLTGGAGSGTVFRIDRLEPPGRFTAGAVSGVEIYPCAGAWTDLAAQLLTRTLARGGQRFVDSLRTDEYAREEACWLHSSGFCLSIREADALSGS